MSIELSRNEGASLHHQIMIVLRSQIHSGQFSDGMLVPGETSLMAQYGVSRATVRRALLTLENEGLIQRRQGKGTRVTYRPSRDDSGFAHDIHKIETLAARTKVRVLSFEWAMATPEAQAALGIAPDLKALRIARVRSAGDTPLRFIVNFIPAALGEHMHSEQFSRSTLLAVLKQLGHEPRQFDDTIGAIVADPELARTLEVRIGAPLIELSRVIYGREKAPLAYQWTAIPPGRGMLRTSIRADSD